MATCNLCEQTADTYRCTKCEQVFCFTHLQMHRDQSIQELSQIQDGINDIRQRIHDEESNLRYHPLIRTIDAWERNSIRKIRESLTKKSNRHRSSLEKKLNNLSDQVQNFSKKTTCDKAQMTIWNQNIG